MTVKPNFKYFPSHFNRGKIILRNKQMIPNQHMIQITLWELIVKCNSFQFVKCLDLNVSKWLNMQKYKIYGINSFPPIDR